MIWESDTENESPNWQERVGWYGVSGIPHVQFQGTTPEVGGGNDCYERYLAHYNNIEPTDSPIDLSFTYTINGTTIDVVADATLTGDITTTDNNMYFIVTRRIDNDYFCTVEVYESQSFTQTTNGEQGQYSQPLTIEADWVITDLSIVVMVQTATGTYEIIQAARGDIDPNSVINVTATNMYTNEPIANALVTAGLYEDVTDANGQCALPVWEGTYDVVVEKEGYVDHISTAVTVDENTPANIAAQMDEFVLPPANLTQDVAGNWVWLTWAEPGLPDYVIEEDFENGFPAGWTETTNASVGWQVGTNGGSQYFEIPGHTSYAYVNDDATGDGSDGSEDWMIMSAIDLTGSIDCGMSFASYYNGSYGQLAYVKASTDGGTTWEVLEQLAPADGWTTITIDLNAYIDQSNLLIAFHTDDAGEWASGWAIDDVKIGFLGMQTLVQGYNIYMDDNTTPSNPEMLTDLEYIVTDVPLGDHEFVVKAIFSPGESEPCDLVNAEVTVDMPFYPPTQFSYGIEYVVDVTVSWDVPNPVRLQRVDSNGNITGEAGRADERDRDHIGYNVYRDGELVDFVSGTANNTLQMLDHEFGNFTYEFTSVYAEGESFKFGELIVLVQEQEIPALFVDDIEEMTLWQNATFPWTTYDLDGTNTYSIVGADFPGSGESMPFIGFNPQETTPPMEAFHQTHSGDLCFATFASETTANDDWLISQPVELYNLPYVGFWAKSLSTQYGEDQFEVAVSNGSIDPADFTVISGDTPLTVPQGWTNIQVSLGDYEDQMVRVGIHCVSEGTLAFLVDDFGIYSAGGVDNADDVVTPATTQLLGNYPNPFNPTTNIAFEIKDAGLVSIDVYDIRGRKVRTLTNDNFTAGRHSVVWNGIDDNDQSVASGVYFYKLTSGDFQATNKMIMMK